MQITWLRRGNHRQCILFFAGWGMDSTPFAGVPAAETDLCMVYDYRALAPINLTPFVDYEQVHLVAWSMGVWMAAHLLADHQGTFATLTAIGGTLQPIDQQRGIPPASYNDMLAHFSPEILDGFYRNMFDEDEQLGRFLAHRPRRDVDDLCREMESFQEAYQQFGPGMDIYSRKIITSRDRIFSGRNQMRAWGKGCGTICNWPHFPFFLVQDWHDLLVD